MPDPGVLDRRSLVAVELDRLAVSARLQVTVGGNRGGIESSELEALEQTALVINQQ
ncbi:hypothetical protein D3C79_1089680 [compost metagenome]